MDRLFAVLNTAGNIVARGPAECAPDASLIKGGQYRLKFFEGEKDARIWRPSSKSNAER